MMISDPNHPDLAIYSTLRKDSLNDGLFVAESLKVVKKLIDSDYELVSLLVSESFLSENSDFLSDKDYQVVSDAVSESMTGKKYHKGIMAIGKMKPFISLENLDGPILVLNGLTSPENVGAMMRNAAGFGVKNVLFDHRTCHPFLKRCIRVGMGNTFFLNFYESHDLRSDLLELKEFGYQIIGTANESNSISLREFKFPKDSALIIGSEGDGMDEEIKACSDVLLKIPMIEGVQHFNAACASAVFLYEISQSSNLL
ncbi:MAG: RNA methyltransferase [Deltaproteobacteria bacterium]|nr:MAG: RNA methyltransferase [Deltaproteobacteria bacterium]